jgi:hypothetical protein
LWQYNYFLNALHDGLPVREFSQVLLPERRRWRKFDIQLFQKKCCSMILSFFLCLISGTRVLTTYVTNLELIIQNQITSNVKYTTNLVAHCLFYTAYLYFAVENLLAILTTNWDGFVLRLLQIHPLAEVLEALHRWVILPQFVGATFKNFHSRLINQCWFSLDRRRWPTEAWILQLSATTVPFVVKPAAGPKPIRGLHGLKIYYVHIQKNS